MNIFLSLRVYSAEKENKGKHPSGGINIKDTLIRRLALILAVCTAFGTAGAAVAGGVAGPAAQIPAPTASSAATAAPTPTPTPRPTPTPEPVDNSIWADGVVNILFIGTDELYGEEDRGRGDVTMLCSLNKNNAAVKLISFERSIGMPWPDHGDVMLTNTYAYGGAELMCQDISRCFRVDIDGYVQMDFEGFSSIIDAMGGVEVYLDAQEAQALTEDLFYDQWFAEGDSHLDGQAALRYCRLRRIDDNWRRVERQRNVVQAIQNKARDLRFSQIKEVAKLVIGQINTDLSRAQLMALAFSAPRFVHSTISQMTVPDRNHVWTYNSGEETVTGCDFGAESRRLNEFIYGEKPQEVMAAG